MLSELVSIPFYIGHYSFNEINNKTNSNTNKVSIPFYIGHYSFDVDVYILKDRKEHVVSIPFYIGHYSFSAIYPCMSIALDLVSIPFYIGHYSFTLPKTVFDKINKQYTSQSLFI